MMCETLVFVYGLYIYHTYVLVRSLLCVHTYVRSEKKGSHCFGVFRLVAIDEKGLHQLHRMALSPKFPTHSLLIYGNVLDIIT